MSLRPYSALLIVVAGLTGCRYSAPLPAPEVGMWYWHTPFRLSDADMKGLKDIGVTTLYVRAGTFASDGKTVSLIQPQKWEGRTGDLGLVLTFNFHPGLVKHLESLPAPQIADDVAKSVEESWKQASKVAIPKGVQFDIDCPTRILPLYAQILTSIHERLKANNINGSFSATALPTWLTSKNVETLAKSVDFLVPQFYEGRTGKTADQVFPVSDPAGMRDGLRRIAKLGIPCQVGMATYGHALLFDDHQNLVTMYHGLSAEDALRHPYFKEQSSVPLTAAGRTAPTEKDATGEDRLILRAIRPDARGNGLGFWLAYLLPTPQMLTRQIAVFQAERSANVRGYILYRFPEPGESMSLPLASIAAGLHGEKLAVSAKVRITSRPIPWKLIDPKSTANRAPRELTIHLQSTGNTPTRASHEAVQLMVFLNRPGIDGLAPGDFDEAENGTLDDQGRFLKTAPANADVIRFRRYHLLPRELLRSGDILLPPDAATEVSTRWQAQGPGGFETFSGHTENLKIEQMK